MLPKHSCYHYTISQYWLRMLDSNQRTWAYEAHEITNFSNPLYSQEPFFIPRFFVLCLNHLATTVTRWKELNLRYIFLLYGSLEIISISLFILYHLILVLCNGIFTFFDAFILSAGSFCFNGRIRPRGRMFFYFSPLQFRDYLLW